MAMASTNSDHRIYDAVTLRTRHIHNHVPVQIETVEGERRLESRFPLGPFETTPYAHSLKFNITPPDQFSMGVDGPPYVV